MKRSNRSPVERAPVRKTPAGKRPGPKTPATTPQDTPITPDKDRAVEGNPDHLLPNDPQTTGHPHLW